MYMTAEPRGFDECGEGLPVGGGTEEGWGGAGEGGFLVEGKGGGVDAAEVVELAGVEGDGVGDGVCGGVAGGADGGLRVEVAVAGVDELELALCDALGERRGGVAGVDGGGQLELVVCGGGQGFSVKLATWYCAPSWMAAVRSTA